MFGLNIVDILVIALYFVIILVIGFRAMRNIKNQEDYFLGGRRFGKLVQIFAAFGQATSADSAVGTTTTTYQNGASGIWSALLFLWGTPIYWLTSPWYRRLRVLTLGDFFEERFGSKRMAAFYAIIASMFLMSFIAIGMKAVTYTVQGITQKQSADFTPAEQDEYTRALELDELRQAKANTTLDKEQHQRLELLEAQRPHREFSYVHQTTLVWIICGVVFLYAVTGGLEAAMCTEYMARPGMPFQKSMPLLKKYGVAAINWGFVSGKTGTVWGWKTKKGKNLHELRKQKENILQPGEAFPEPKVWFHDIYRIDGTPYSKEEIIFIKKMTGKYWRDK